MQKTFSTFLWVNIPQSALSLVQLMVVEMHPCILDSEGMICVVIVVLVVVEVNVVVGQVGLLLLNCFSDHELTHLHILLTHHTMHGLLVYLNLDPIVSHTILKTSARTWLRIPN